MIITRTDNLQCVSAQFYSGRSSSGSSRSNWVDDSVLRRCLDTVSGPTPDSSRPSWCIYIYIYSRRRREVFRSCVEREPASCCWYPGSRRSCWPAPGWPPRARVKVSDQDLAYVHVRIHTITTHAASHPVTDNICKYFYFHNSVVY